MEFCDVCENVLKQITTSTRLYSKCAACQKEYESTSSDTLRYTKHYGKKILGAKHATLVKNAAFDITNPKVKKKCSNCTNQYMSYIVIGDNMKYIYVCTCGNQL